MALGLDISGGSSVEITTLASTLDSIVMAAQDRLIVNDDVIVTGNADLGDSSDIRGSLTADNLNVAGLSAFTNTTIIGQLSVDTLHVDAQTLRASGGVAVTGDTVLTNGASLLFSGTDARTFDNVSISGSGRATNLIGNVTVGDLDLSDGARVTLFEGVTIDNVTASTGAFLTVSGNVDAGTITVDTGASLSLFATGLLNRQFDLDLGRMEFAQFIGSGLVLQSRVEATQAVTIGAGDGERMFATVKLVDAAAYTLRGSHIVGEGIAVDGGVRANFVSVTGRIDGDVILGKGADSFVIEGSRGSGLLDMGDGSDVVDLAVDWTGDVIMGNGNDRVTLDAEVQISGRLELGDGNDTVEGSNLADTFDGGSGADVMFTNFGDDVLTMGAGSDLAFADAGRDRIFGGDGEDELYGVGGADFIRGGRQGDTVDGGAGNDTLYGDGGDDLVSGRSGDDRIFGNQGDDSILGGGGEDVIFGGGGNDTIEAGRGQDTLNGGGGNDVFVFSGARAIAETGGVSGFLRDVISDFTQGQDIIDLSAIDADTTTGGDQAFTFVGTAGFTGTAGELRFEDVGGTIVVSGDVNGNGAADFELDLTGAVVLVAGDFVL